MLVKHGGHGARRDEGQAESRQCGGEGTLKRVPWSERAPTGGRTASGRWPSGDRCGDGGKGARGGEVLGVDAKATKNGGRKWEGTGHRATEPASGRGLGGMGRMSTATQVTRVLWPSAQDDTCDTHQAGEETDRGGLRPSERKVKREREKRALGTHGRERRIIGDPAYASAEDFMGLEA